jgi:subtilisin family serine protease
LVLVDTTLPAQSFRDRYEQAGAVLVSEAAFPNVSRALWEFSANNQQFSLLRASLTSISGASVLATSSRGEDAITATYSTTLWNLDRLDQISTNYDNQYNPGAGYTGASVNAYVFDTGVVPNHPDLAGRVTLEYSAYAPQYADDNGHGSHVSGTIAGTTYGVAKAARIRSYKILDSHGGGTIKNLADALTFLRANVVKPAVINLSLTYSGYDAVVDALLLELLAMDVLIFSAAGNSNVDACATYPCITSGVICMGATTRLDQRSSFSNYGACVDLFGPGSAILSINKNGVGTALMDGTSMATPHSVGVAALALQANPFLTSIQLANMMIANSIKNQLLATTLGARSNNRMLYAVWGAQPTTTSLVATSMAVTTVSSGTTTTIDATSTSIARTTSAASTATTLASASATSTARTTTLSFASGNAKATSTEAASTSMLATSTLSASTRGTTTVRATNIAATTLSRTISASATRTQSNTVAVSTTGSRSTTRAISTTAAASGGTKTSKTVSQGASAVTLGLSISMVLTVLLTWLA